MRFGAKTCISSLHGRITIIRKPQLISCSNKETLEANLYVIYALMNLFLCVIMTKQLLTSPFIIDFKFFI